MKQLKIVEIGPWPPPASGWSIRIRFLREGFQKLGQDCQILNIGDNRTVKSTEYIDVQGGGDYLKKLILLRLQGYAFHAHLNAQSVKGPILSLIAILVSLFTLRRAAITFHGGIQQLYFPRESGGRMHPVLFLNFLLAGCIICNNEAIKEEIVRYGKGINPKKIHPIPAFSVQYAQTAPVPLPQRLEHFLSAKTHIISCYLVLRNGFYIDTLLGLIARLADKGTPEATASNTNDIGFVLIGVRQVEDTEVEKAYRKLLDWQEKGVVLLVENLDHDEFLTVLGRSHLCLRTPVSDGVASSVLEALALRLPVVASENGRRPAGVITYAAEDSLDCAAKVRHTLDNLDTIRSGLTPPAIRDTVSDEIEALTAALATR